MQIDIRRKQRLVVRLLHQHFTLDQLEILLDVLDLFQAVFFSIKVIAFFC